MNFTELELYTASKAGDVSKVKAVLNATPTVNVNKKNPRDVRDDDAGSCGGHMVCGAVERRHGADQGCRARPSWCDGGAAREWRLCQCERKRKYRV
jgi:hypothetical protein